MTTIITRKRDVAWNYIGTVFSMLSGFILLPLLMMFLSDDELGLWYVYLAIANLVQLFEFGFNPTFARNIVYVLCGAKRLVAIGRAPNSEGSEIDWHLLNAVIRASKIIYACIAIVALVLLATIGSAYISAITNDMETTMVWVTWSLFCFAMLLNMYYLYSITQLRGYGDVAGENKARTFGKVAQLSISGILLVGGFGLVGASIGYLTNAVTMRLFAIIFVRRHKEIEAGRKTDNVRIERSELLEIFRAITHIAWRDGVVQLALYASTQATSILASIYLGLAETGTYSILLQFSNAVYLLASAYPKSFYPAMQSAYAMGDRRRQGEISASGITAYWLLIVVGTLGVATVVLPLLPLIKPDIEVDYGLFLALCLYLSLLTQHSIFCNYIVCMNEIPYLYGYVISAVLGAILVWVFCAIMGLGAWGIVLGQALSQIVYNNWKWPIYYCKKINTTYVQLMRDGINYWRHRLTQYDRKTPDKK